MEASPGPVSFQELVPHPDPAFFESEEVIGDQLFLYGRDSDLVYQLNDGAAVVWLLCDGQRNLGDIAREIADNYGLSPQTALDEVREAVTQFNSLGLLQSAGTP